MPINKKTVFINVASIAAFALIILFPILVAQAESSTAFDPTYNFAIPALNGEVNFALNGTYAQASLENGIWSFVNLQTSNLLRPLNLSISAIDCNVTVTSCRTFNITIVGAFLSFLVEGQGNQTFRLSPLQRGGDWTVTFNGSFIGENEGWTLSPNGTIAVTKAPSGSNVTLAYFVFPDALGGNGNNSNLPFYQRHSVIIATGVAVTITVAAAVAVTFVSKRNQRNRAVRESLR